MSVELLFAAWILFVFFTVWMLMTSTRIERVRGKWRTREEKSKQLTKMGILMILMFTSGGLALALSTPISFKDALLITLLCAVGSIGIVLLMMIPARIIVLGTPPTRKRKRE